MLCNRMTNDRNPRSALNQSLGSGLRTTSLLRDRGQTTFEALVRAYSAELYRYAYWLCRDRFAAEDLVQEAFARAWQSWDGLRDDRAAKGWLYTILRNEHARLHERKQFAIDPDQDVDEILDVSRARAAAPPRSPARPLAFFQAA